MVKKLEEKLITKTTIEDRMNEIKELISERNKFVEEDGHIETYEYYDEFVFELNDEGHIDWLVKIVDEQRMTMEKVLKSSVSNNNMETIKILKSALSQ